MKLIIIKKMYYGYKIIYKNLNCFEIVLNAFNQNG